MLLETETKLRKFCSEIMTPFNERITAVEKNIKSLRSEQDQNRDKMETINAKLDREVKVREQVSDLNIKLLKLDQSTGTEMQKISGRNEELILRIQAVKEQCKAFENQT